MKYLLLLLELHAQIVQHQYQWLYTTLNLLSSPKKIPRILHHVRPKPLLHRRDTFNPAISPCARIPPVRRPVTVDIRPGREIILFDHVLHAGQVVDETVRVSAAGRLDGGLGDELGLRRPLNVRDKVRIDGAAGAIGRAADGEADVVVEDGEAWIGQYQPYFFIHNVRLEEAQTHRSNPQRHHLDTGA